jgi:hypothetical protein
MISPEVDLSGDGFPIGNGLTAVDPGENIIEFLEPLGRNNDVDVAADGLTSGISEQALGGGIPAGDRAVELSGDDRVVGGLNHRGEQALTFPGLSLFGNDLASQGMK